MMIFIWVSVDKRKSAEKVSLVQFFKERSRTII
jgi:hypothetical protein